MQKYEFLIFGIFGVQDKKNLHMFIRFYVSPEIIIEYYLMYYQCFLIIGAIFEGLRGILSKSKKATSFEDDWCCNAKDWRRTREDWRCKMQD